MKRALALMLLLGSAAHAQIVRPIGETPGDLGPTTTTTPEKPLPATTGARFSAFSAGRGGALFAFSEGVGGLVLGGVLGAGLSSGGALVSAQGVYLGALAGGVVLGALGSVLQYVQPIGLVAAGATSLGLVVGGLAGFGVASLLSGLGSVALPGLLALVGAQVGGLVPLALSWATEDLEPSALAMMGAAALSAFALTGLVNLAIGRPLVPAALLLAPAVGMAIGGLIAAVSRVQVSTIFRYAGLPLGAALALFAIVAGVFESVQLGAAVALGGAAVTLGVTALVTFATAPAKPEAVSLLPTVVVVPGRGSALSVGPGAVIRF